MLPPTLLSIYQQYKDDTNSIAAWLASTAKSVGYPADLLTANIVKPATSGRLKGKARKQQAKPAKPSPAPGAASTRQQPKHTVPVKDFIPLAEFVAAKKVAVPWDFQRTIERVITARSGFGSKLKNSGHDIPHLANAQHMHFVGGR